MKNKVCFLPGMWGRGGGGGILGIFGGFEALGLILEFYGGNMA